MQTRVHVSSFQNKPRALFSSSYSMKNNMHGAGSLHFVLSEFVCHFIVPGSSAHAT